jgi:hypothetical protein
MFTFIGLFYSVNVADKSLWQNLHITAACLIVSAQKGHCLVLRDSAGGKYSTL